MLGSWQGVNGRKKVENPCFIENGTQSKTAKRFSQSKHATEIRSACNRSSYSGKVINCLQYHKNIIRHMYRLDSILLPRWSAKYLTKSASLLFCFVDIFQYCSWWWFTKYDKAETLNKILFSTFVAILFAVSALFDHFLIIDYTLT